jgi:hypothetical protein
LTQQSNTGVPDIGGMTVHVPRAEPLAAGHQIGNLLDTNLS